MHLKFIRLALFSCSSLLLVHSAIAQIIPAPATPPPIIDPGTLIGPTPNPTPPPVTPPPVATPTVPPVSPPPIPTPTVNTSPLDKYLPEPPKPPPSPTVPPAPTIPPAPTVPPLSSPPPISIPPVLERAAPQAATAVIRYGPGYTLNLTPRNDWGRFQKVALQPNQAVMVVLTLNPADLGKPADVQILDGGAIAADLPTIPTPFPAPTFNGPSNGSETTPTPSPGSPADPNDILPYLINTGQIMTVSTTGQLIFHFKAGADIGLHRVSVIAGGNQYFFQFWRQNPSAPNNNPGMLRAY